MQTVVLENGDVHEFPDSATPQQIREALKGSRVISASAPGSARASKEPRTTTNSVNQFFSDAGLGAGQGMLNIIPGLANLGISGVNALTGSNISKVPMFDYAPHTIGADVGNIASFFTPGVAAKTAAAVPRIAGMAAGALEGSPLLKSAANFAQNNPMTTSVAGNALLGGAYAPNNPGMGMALGGAAPILGKYIPQGVSAAYQKLRPSNMLRGNLSDADLARNLQNTAGTNTDLGNVIGSPTLKFAYENMLGKIPFGGAANVMQKTGAQIVQRGHELMGDLLGNNAGENASQLINDAIESSFQAHQKQKNNLYGRANNLAAKENLQLDLPEFSQTAKKLGAGLESTNILKYEPDLSALINKLQNYKNPVATDGEKTIFPSLQEANILKGRLNQLADQYNASSDMQDRHAAGVFGKLGNALKNDIQTSIDQNGSKALQGAYSDAEKNYAENFSPFLDKEIYKFAIGKSDPDTILQSFIKTGRANDRANLLNGLMSKLSPDQKNLVGYGYLSRAFDREGNTNVLNPLKFRSLVSENALGPRQMQALFPDPVMRQRIMDYADLAEKNKRALSVLVNPENGQINASMVAMLMKTPGGLIGKIAGSRGLTNLLTSEQTRQNLVNKMLANSAAQGGQ